MKALLVSSVFSWDGGTSRLSNAEQGSSSLFCFSHKSLSRHVSQQHQRSCGRLSPMLSFSCVLQQSPHSGSCTWKESLVTVCVRQNPRHHYTPAERPVHGSRKPLATGELSSFSPQPKHSRMYARKLPQWQCSIVTRSLKLQHFSAFVMKSIKWTRRRRVHRLVAMALKKKPQLVIPDAIKVEPGKYSYDVENAINQLSALAPRASITRCMDSYRNKLSMKDFSVIFREFGQRGDWERALRLFKYMQRQQWCKPHEHVYTILIGILGREGLLDKCSEIFEEMPNHGVDWNVYSFTALINAYGRNGQYEASLHLLSRMKRERVAPNLITYNTVINACAKGGMDWEGLLGLFAQMRHEGIQPDIITYNTLLGACSLRRLNEEAKMVFRTMNEAGVVPDQTTYSLLVETFRGLNSLDSVSDLLREMEISGNVPDTIAYNVLLEAFAKAGDVPKAAGVFKQMVQAGCTPNVNTYSTLLECYGKHGRFDDVRELFTEMQASGTAPDTVTYNTLIQTFGKGGYFKEVVSLFDAMIDGSVIPDLETYVGLLHACGMAGLHQEARRMYKHMRERDLKPNSAIFNGLILAYGRAAMYQEADIAFNSRIELDCKVDETTFDSLIHVYAKAGLCKEAAAMVADMKKAGHSLTINTYKSFMEVFGRAGLLQPAKRVFIDLQEAGHLPDMEIYETLLIVYCTEGLFDEAKAQFLEMKELGSTPEITAYCLMLSISARRSRWDDVRKLLDEMQGSAMPNLHVLVAGLIRGNFDEMVNWNEIVQPALESIKVNGIESNMMFYNALMEVLWWSGQKSRAARVFGEARTRGVFPEAFSKTSAVWSIDVHRMTVGAALTTLLVWLEEMQLVVKVGEELPKLFSIITRRTQEEEEVEPPVSKMMFATLESMGAPFKFAPWNKGCILSFKDVLVPWLEHRSIPEEFVDTVLPIPNTSYPASASSVGLDSSLSNSSSSHRSKQLTAL